MKYAKEVIDLLAAYPRTRFKMTHIVNHIDRKACGSARLRIRVGALRALKVLQEHGQVTVWEPTARGGSAEYQWKSDTSSLGNLMKSDTETDTLAAGQLRPPFS